MKNRILQVLAIIIMINGNELLYGQCSTATSLGSSSNAFTNGINETNAIVVDNDLNTVLFVHRNNASAFGGNSGQLRYDISTNNGTSWTSNLGVLNPLNTFQARYPQISMYNPASNTAPNNAYLSYLAPTINGAVFNSIVYGANKLDGSGNSESYIPEDPSQDYTPKSMVKGSPGTFWAIDRILPGGVNPSGLAIFKGVWNTMGNTIDWSLDEAIGLDYNLSFNGSPQFAGGNIGFDPSGQVGWISILTHLNGNATPFSFYPVFYKTVDGGTTWTGPIYVDMENFSCYNPMLLGANVLSTDFSSDLVVDVYGNPHMVTTLCNGNNAYAVFLVNQHRVVDITYNGAGWEILDLAEVKAGRGTFGTNPNALNQDMYEMASRTDDGTKVFFGWLDNASYSTGQSNTSPNFFSKSYDVVAKKWTAVNDKTSCNATLNGKMNFPKMATNVIEDVPGQYKMAVVQTVLTSNDPLLVANFNYVDNLIWNDSDYTNFANTDYSTVVAGDWGSTEVWGNICLSPGLIIPQGITVNVDHDVNLSGELIVRGNLNIAAGVTMNISGNFVNEGAIKNNGTITTTSMNTNTGSFAGGGQLTGSLNNNGSISPKNN